MVKERDVMKKDCVLYDRKCIGCGECDMCDLDPQKKCDNCGKCIESGNDYNIMDIDLPTPDGEEPLNYHYDGEIVSDEEFLDEDFEDDYENIGNIEDIEDIDDETEDDDLGFDFGELFGTRG
jgi:hypothetical protein